MKIPIEKGDRKGKEKVEGIKRPTVTSKAIATFTLSIIVAIFSANVFGVISLQTQQLVYAVPLSMPAAIPSNNIVSTTSTYEITFNTVTSGVVKTVEIAFPASYNVAGAKLIERARINEGILSRSGNTLLYSVTSPVNIAANTPVRLELANIVNTNVGTTATITITTKNTAGTIIDGPTSTSIPIKQIEANDIGFTIKPDFLTSSGNAPTGLSVLVAYCPNGTTAIAGGFYSNVGDPLAQVTAFGPSSDFRGLGPNGWAAQFANPKPFPVGVSVTASCVSLAP